MSKLRELVNEINDLKHLVNSMDSTVLTKSAAYNSVIAEKAQKLVDLLIKNNKIDPRQKDEVLEKLSDQENTLDLFYSYEKLASGAPHDDFGELRNYNVTKNSVPKRDAAQDAFISILFSN